MITIPNFEPAILDIEVELMKTTVSFMFSFVPVMVHQDASINFNHTQHFGNASDWVERMIQCVLAMDDIEAAPLEEARQLLRKRKAGPNEGYQLSFIQQRIICCGQGVCWHNLQFTPVILASSLFEVGGNDPIWSSSSVSLFG